MKMSARERTLAMAVGSIVFLLVNMLLVTAFCESRRNAELRADLASRQLELANINEMLSQRALWAQRDAALTARQPRLTKDENAAGVELLDLIRSIAKQHEVTLENPVFAGATQTKTYRSVPVNVDTHSSWPSLVDFLYALQKPDQFIVCESANIQVDPSDQTKMLCHFKIARWYAHD